MRISEETRFPYPVLSKASQDFSAGEFDVQFIVYENLDTGALSLEHKMALTEPAIQELVRTGQAAVGCFVRCNDTYFTELRPLSWPAGRSDFPAGSVMNRVSLRPIIWLEQDLSDWDPGTIHPEFAPPVSLKRGDLLATAQEIFINVGLAKLTPLESIFELELAPEVPEGRIRVEPDADRITIKVGSPLYETINLLRGQTRGQPVVINSVYLPAVMEILDLLGGQHTTYEGRRWFQPFMAKCDLKGIRTTPESPIFENAQILLEAPARSLSHLLAENES